MRWRTVVPLAALIALAAVLPASAASAHSALVESSPAAESTVTAELAEVTLTFNEEVLDLGGAGSSSTVEVTDAAGLHYEAGCAASDVRTVALPVALGAAGEYTVAFSVVSADGHRVEDAFAFTYQPPAGAAAASGYPTAGCADGVVVGREPAASESPSEQPTASATPPATEEASDASEQDTENRIVLLIAGIIVVLAGIGVVVAIVLTRRRPAE